MSGEKWKCPNCGAENEMDDNFCGECGCKKPAVGIATAGRVIPQANPIQQPVQTVNKDNTQKKEKNGISRVKVTIAIISICCVVVFLVVINAFQQAQQREADKAEAYRLAKEAEAKKAEEDRKNRELEAKKAEDERKKQELEAKEKAAEVQRLAEEEAKRKAAAAAKAKKLKDWEKGHLLTSNLYWIYGGKKTWSSAKRYCGSFTDKEMGFSGWRLPTVNELKSLNGKESDRYWNSSEYSYWDNRNKGVGTDSDPRHKVEYMFYCVRNK